MSKCLHQEGSLPFGKVERIKNGKENIPLVLVPGWDSAHDCDYVDARNALIPSAEKLANRAVMTLPSRSDKDDVLNIRQGWPVWSIMFHAAMDCLWKLRSGALSPATVDPFVEVCRVGKDWTARLVS